MKLGILNRIFKKTKKSYVRCLGIEYESRTDVSLNCRPTIFYIDEVENFIQKIMLEDGFLIVTDVEGHGDDFLLWISGEYALVQIHTTLQYVPYDPSRVNMKIEPVWFFERGELFSAPYSKTITRTQGFEALDEWIRKGTKTDDLTWAYYGDELPNN